MPNPAILGGNCRHIIPIKIHKDYEPTGFDGMDLLDHYKWLSLQHRTVSLELKRKIDSLLDSILGGA